MRTLQVSNVGLMTLVVRLPNNANQSDGFSVPCFAVLRYATAKQSTTKPQLFAALSIIESYQMLSWRYPLDEIRKEVRKSRTDGNSSISLDGVENLIDELASVCSEVDAKEKSEFKEDDSLKEFFVAQREMITTSYEQGKQYANIIVLGGYAGLFAIWNFTKSDLAQWQTFTVGLSILLSLTTYIVFELYSSWLRSTQVFNQLRELEEAEKLNEIPAEYGKAELARAKRFIKLWPFFFFSAIGFALAAVLVLGYSFICGLL